MPDFRAPLKVNQNPIIEALLDPRTSDPASPIDGQVWYRTDTDVFHVRINGATKSFRLLDVLIQNADLAGSIALSKLATDPLARANHTGTQTAATISDFDTQVRTSRLDQMAAPTNDVPFNNRKITGLANGVASTDAATLGQVQSLVQGLDPKESVYVATTANIALTGIQTIDGQSVGGSSQRVLVKSQTDPNENGIYVSASGAWTRSTDTDTAADLTGAFVFVERGTVNADTGWIQTNDSVAIGSTPITWVQFTGAGQITAGAGLTKTGNTLDVGQSTGIIVGADAISINDSLVARRYSYPITTDGVATAWTIPHNLGLPSGAGSANGTRPPIMSVWLCDASWIPVSEVQTDVEWVDSNTARIRMSPAPANGLNFVAAMVA